MKKKVEKSEIEQNICVLLTKMQKWAFKLRGVQKKSRPPNHNNKERTLGGPCFKETKWRVAFKSDDSYTKREVATVQGAQQ